MATGIQGEGLSFLPLFWTHHDSWRYTVPAGLSTEIRYHHGHTHLFMPGYRFDLASQDAFTGRMRFSFEIKDEWGPRSSDPNQSETYRVIGTPKWYFHVQELWRRVYVQPWDEKVDMPDGTVVGRRGIKWDASPRSKILGPFREGAKFSPLYLEGGGRTLPIEYFKTEARNRKLRDNYVKDNAQVSIAAWNASPLGALFPRTFDEAQWDLDHDAFLDVGHPAGKPTWSDMLYIWPIMEYQTVTQLNWQRLPGAEANNDRDENNFGDGWSQQLTIPFVNPITQKYNSPFGANPGQVAPVGEYFGTDGQGNPLVPAAKRLKHRKRDDHPPGFQDPGGYDYVNEPFGLPAFSADPDETEWEPPVTVDPRTPLSETPMFFHDPYEQSDGRWVQQCLGGIIQARADVTLEHKLGGRTTRSISATQYLPTTKFAGTDQYQITG